MKPDPHNSRRNYDRSERVEFECPWLLASHHHHSASHSFKLGLGPHVLTSPTNPTTTSNRPPVRNPQPQICPQLYHSSSDRLKCVSETFPAVHTCPQRKSWKVRGDHGSLEGWFDVRMRRCEREGGGRKRSVRS